MTGKMMNFNGVPLSIPNDVTIQTQQFYISYNDRDTSIYGDVTTALVLTKQDNPMKFLILDGNHTKEYEEIISKGGSYSDCLEYFKNNLHRKSKFSDNWNETIMIGEDGSLYVVKDPDDSKIGESQEVKR